MDLKASRPTVFSSVGVQSDPAARQPLGRVDRLASEGILAHRTRRALLDTWKQRYARQAVDDRSFDIVVGRNVGEAAITAKFDLAGTDTTQRYPGLIAWSVRPAHRLSAPMRTSRA